ncbi:GNAT family N-acetyltransferase [Phanerochaete sordida]|uniref:GNAT family N-acetyltransferase n=1 Tax=Phanerochaete sordida TaxID=48140 RepID=A0A9P3LF02_9APHY|nr:GNAT family N-acetyltransferase [Phanerochaete sordida]
MSTPASSWLEYNPTTGEPFIRLPSPHTNLILTPPRLGDADANYTTMQDPRVYKTLSGPPFPYLQRHATEWLALIVPQAADALREARAAEAAASAGAPVRVGSCPVRYIREVRADGSDVLLGDIDVHRCAYPDVADVEERLRLAKVNADRELGDPEIDWCIGDCLAAPYHGKGIMTAALAALMEHWLMPRMGVRKIRVETFEGNIGSVRVFEKNGFALEETVHWNLVTNCGVVNTGYHILWWRAP